MPDDDFLLTTPIARRLFHEVARDLPIIDYHCHLNPSDLAEDRTFENLTQLWIAGDPYKHRAMRIAGVPEADITGPADDRTKFDRWAATVPQTLGNPLYDWTALELRRYFDIDQPLSPATADAVWQSANARLREPAFSARSLLRRHNVRLVFTSDRLLDDLGSHQTLQPAADGSPRVVPSLRADEIVAIDSPAYLKWLDNLGAATGCAVTGWEEFCRAITARLDAFGALGCVLADYGLPDTGFCPVAEQRAATLFGRAAKGEKLSVTESTELRTGMLVHLGGEYARRGWVMQLHLGAQRATSSRLRSLAGPQGGFACPGSPLNIGGLCALLDAIEQRAGHLPRTIIYPLNPADYAPVAVLTGSFAADGVRGLVQLGPAWWYNDHIMGMEIHLDTLASYGLLATFVGMTTDSRSLLSTVRHEYFRRVACGWIGRRAASGRITDNVGELGALVRAICYENAAGIFRA